MINVLNVGIKTDKNLKKASFSLSILRDLTNLFSYLVMPQASESLLYSDKPID